MVNPLSKCARDHEFKPQLHQLEGRDNNGNVLCQKKKNQPTLVHFMNIILDFKVADTIYTLLYQLILILPIYPILPI